MLYYNIDYSNSILTGSPESENAKSNRNSYSPDPSKIWVTLDVPEKNLFLLINYYTSYYKGY